MPSNKFFTTLAKLKLGNNDNGIIELQKLGIDDVQSDMLITVLEKHPELTVLDLARNKIGDKGAEDLSRLIRASTTLRQVDLTENPIGLAGARALESALKENQTIGDCQMSIVTFGQAEEKEKQDILSKVESYKIRNRAIWSKKLFEELTGKIKQLKDRSTQYTVSQLAGAQAADELNLEQQINVDFWAFKKECDSLNEEIHALINKLRKLFCTPDLEDSFYRLEERQCNESYSWITGLYDTEPLRSKHTNRMKREVLRNTIRITAEISTCKAELVNLSQYVREQVQEIGKEAYWSQCDAHINKLNSLINELRALDPQLSDSCKKIVDEINPIAKQCEVCANSLDLNPTDYEEIAAIEAYLNIYAIHVLKGNFERAQEYRDTFKHWTDEQFFTFYYKCQYKKMIQERQEQARNSESQSLISTSAGSNSLSENKVPASSSDSSTTSESSSTTAGIASSISSSSSINASNTKVPGSKKFAELLQQIRAGNCPKHFSLENEKINDDQAIELALALTNNSTVSVLDLTNNFIEDRGIEELSKCVSTLKELRILKLEGNFFGEKGVHALKNALKVNTSVAFATFNDNILFENEADRSEVLAEIKIYTHRNREQWEQNFKDTLNIEIGHLRTYATKYATAEELARQDFMTFLKECNQCYFKCIELFINVRKFYPKEAQFYIMEEEFSEVKQLREHIGILYSTEPLKLLYEPHVKPEIDHLEASLTKLLDQLKQMTAYSTEEQVFSMPEDYKIKYTGLVEDIKGTLVKFKLISDVRGKAKELEIKDLLDDLRKKCFTISLFIPEIRLKRLFKKMNANKDPLEGEKLKQELIDLFSDPDYHESSKQLELARGLRAIGDIQAKLAAIAKPSSAAATTPESDESALFSAASTFEALEFPFSSIASLPTESVEILDLMHSSTPTLGTNSTFTSSSSAVLTSTSHQLASPMAISSASASEGSFYHPSFSSKMSASASQPESEGLGSRVGLSKRAMGDKSLDALKNVGYDAGKAYDAGDCFFDSVAQGINASGVKALRLLCNDYMKKKPVPSWVKEFIDNDAKHGGDDYTKCLMRVQFTTAEMKVNKQNSLFPDDYATWGRPHIEGRMICDVMNIKIHVVQLNEFEGNIVATHDLIDKDGLKTVDLQGVPNDATTVHIAGYAGHFVPLKTLPAPALNMAVAM